MPARADEALWQLKQFNNNDLENNIEGVLESIRLLINKNSTSSVTRLLL
jgi:very-short-patch-repair endonuclease